MTKDGNMIKINANWYNGIALSIAICLILCLCSWISYNHALTLQSGHESISNLNDYREIIDLHRYITIFMAINFLIILYVAFFRKDVIWIRISAIGIMGLLLYRQCLYWNSVWCIVWLDIDFE